MKSEQTIPVNGVDLYAVSQGEGPTVVLMGGPWFGHYYLRPLADEVAREFQVVSYDARGSGRSSALTADQITLDGHLRDLEGVRRGLGIDRMSLIGHSLGALVTLLYAAEHPGNVAALILAHAGPPFDPELQGRLHEAFVKGYTSQDKERLEAIEASPGFRDRDAQTHEEYFKALYVPFFWDRSVLERLDFGFTPTTALYALEAEEQLVHQLHGRDPVEKLGQITSPTLVMHAEHDIIPEAFSQFLAKRIGGAKFARLSDVGHFSYLENPALVGETMVKFLERHGG
ncbi:MAG: alpha/beta fold hydrolase [Anaerolineae bacterium]